MTVRVARCVLQACNVNGHTALNVKLRHDTLDALINLMLEFRRTVGTAPGLFKLDIDAAYKRIPIREEDRWACAVVFQAEDQAVLL